MASFSGVRVSEGSLLSVKRRARDLLRVAELDEKLLCSKSFRTLRRGRWVEFKSEDGSRIAISLSGIGTLRLFRTMFPPQATSPATETVNAA